MIAHFFTHACLSPHQAMSPARKGPMAVTPSQGRSCQAHIAALMLMQDTSWSGSEWLLGCGVMACQTCSQGCVSASLAVGRSLGFLRATRGTRCQRHDRAGSELQLPTASKPPLLSRAARTLPGSMEPGSSFQQRAHKVLGLVRDALPAAAVEARLLRQNGAPARTASAAHREPARPRRLQGPRRTQARHAAAPGQAAFVRGGS
jgi:hypothetical protein